MVSNRKLLFLFLILPGLTMSSAGASTDISVRSSAATSATQLMTAAPLIFEPTTAPSTVNSSFRTRGRGFSVIFDPEGWTINLAAVRREGQAMVASSQAVVRMTVVGHSAKGSILGVQKLPGTVNYFFGRDPSNWQTDIPTYAKVQYKNVRPGVDLVFYGKQRTLEYDLVVAPGVDSSSIKFRVEGAKQMRIDQSGALVIETAAGVLRQEPPHIYQERNGRRNEVRGGYVLAGKNEVAFRVGDYDNTEPLVIDPVLRYSTFLGGSDLDGGKAIAVDTAGHAFVTGYACSADFPNTPGSYRSSFEVACASFVTKFTTDGKGVLFSTYLGDISTGNGIAVDSSGNSYITGFASMDTFPTTEGAIQRTFGGDVDAFFAKLSPTGSKLLYSTFIGGSGTDFGNAIALDSARAVYITGYTHSENFPTTAGALRRECNVVETSCIDAFVIKIRTDQLVPVYSTFLGGSSSDQGEGVAVDGSGNAYIAGVTRSPNFPITIGSGFKFDNDAFVTKLNATGSAIIYSRFLGGSGDDRGHSIDVDSFRNAYIAGETNSKDFPLRNSVRPGCFTTNTFCGNAFVTKLTPTGALSYSRYWGGGGTTGTSVAVTPGGFAYVGGHTSFTAFPTTVTAFQRLHGGQVDFFVARFTPTGKVSYSTLLGGNGAELTPGIAVDGGGNVFLTGTADFETSPFGTPSTYPITPGAYQPKPAGTTGIGEAVAAKIIRLCDLKNTDPSVTICSPANSATVSSPVTIIAGTNDTTPVRITQVFVDGKKIYETGLSAIAVDLPISAGKHRLTVQAIDTKGVMFKTPIYITVK